MYTYSLPAGDFESNLTQYERDGLNHKFNLSDGHAHQHQSDGQREIIAELPKIFYRAENTLQRVLEGEFLTSFFNLAGQTKALEFLGNCMLCFSASTATEVVA